MKLIKIKKKKIISEENIRKKSSAASAKMKENNQHQSKSIENEEISVISISIRRHLENQAENGINISKNQRKTKISINQRQYQRHQHNACENQQTKRQSAAYHRKHQQHGSISLFSPLFSSHLL